MKHKKKQQNWNGQKRRRVVQTASFVQASKQLPLDVQRSVQHKIVYLSTDPRHPSLQVHRLKRTPGMWVCYVSRSYRLLYRWKSGTLFLCDVGRHRVLDQGHPKR